jgi:25S rRNA (cytosine2278-C5)-methyltransferase
MSRQYICAGKAVRAVLEEGKSFKGYCASVKIGKTDYALAAETLKYAEVIQTLLASCSITKSSFSIDLNLGMFTVMVYEILFGKGKISGGGAVKREVMIFIPQLNDAIEILMQERGVVERCDLLPKRIAEASRMPKYIRINILKLSPKQGLDLIQEQCPEAILDEHIRCLAVLPPRSSSFGEHPRVKDGSLIIQDKASCIPSQVIFDLWEGGNIVDSCAAPGNKTSHIAAQVYRQSKFPRPKIYAYDRSGPRSKLLKDRMMQAGANHVDVKNADFLGVDVTAEEFASVRSILCDPSCSGSGLIRSLDRTSDGVIEENEDDGTDEDDRLSRLQQMQLSVVRKAMSFPTVCNVVYSTCSIHDKENEDVVAEVLISNPDWTVVSPPTFSEWPRRGHDHENLTQTQSQALIRCLPQDGLNGFFVANFVRLNQETPQSQQSINIEIKGNGKRLICSHDLQKTVKKKKSK